MHKVCVYVYDDKAVLPNGTIILPAIQFLLSYSRFGFLFDLAEFVTLLSTMFEWIYVVESRF